ncbi:MAG: diphosphomevalonate decarboxylase [Gammaproteobacteria bacterium]|nr:diphosphomevalonate decarboxylase [Gammaproteobacteria bacterium]
MTKKWLAQAPSNIALIKYMGKKDGQLNIPTNASLSYTLSNLRTDVELELSSNKTDSWQAFDNQLFELSEKAQQRFLRHLNMLKKILGVSQTFIVRSANNFPHSSGLASSASSFAALTRCACIALSELSGQALPSIEQQAIWSRQGSGSSCRSFFSPWAIWDNESATNIDLPYQNLRHHVIIISRESKKTSSSEAHAAVMSSPHWAGRPERAEHRLKQLIFSLQSKDWMQAYQICWDEFIDMHELFQTANPAFDYFQDKTHVILEKLKQFWEQHQDGPIITMDAGPNIHLLFRDDQDALANHFIQTHLINQFDYL